MPEYEVASDGTECSITITPPGERKIRIDQIHGERIEHARAMFVKELQELENKDVNALMKKWGVYLIPHTIGDFYSTIMYAEDFPIEQRIHQSEIDKSK